MFPDAFTPRGQVPATPNRLQRAAGELAQGAGSPYAVPSLPVTLAHVEQALDQLASSMQLMAEGVADWCDEEGIRADDDGPARALRWHLRTVANTLIDSRDACPPTRDWARRLFGDAVAEQLGPAATETGRSARCTATASDLEPRPSLHEARAEPNRGRNMSTPEAERPTLEPMRDTNKRARIVCGVDGSAQARNAAIAALALAGQLGARLTLVHVTPTRTLLPVDNLAPGIDPSAYERSTELAYSEAEEAFTSLSPDITPANADREVRLGQPAVVLADLAAEQGAEFIVVGSRGRGAWRSAVLGSVSAEVARLAPCPVMIVPERSAAESRTG